MAKSKWLVSLAKPDPRIGGMDILGKVRKFSKSGYSFILNDAGEAREINKEFGRAASGDIIVSEIPQTRGAKSIKKSSLPKARGDKRSALIKDGWKEVRTGVWRKVMGE